MKYFCCNDHRRIALKGHPGLNGIDYLEVVDNKTDPSEERQTVLLVYFINPLAYNSFQTKNVLIEGGERIQDIQVVYLSFGLGSPPSSPVSSLPAGDINNVLVVKVDKAGDFSTYTLRLVQDHKHTDPPPGFDPLFAAVEFSFKVLCTSEFDCAPSHVCVPESGKAPEINYLAKDYSSFRQLMLDRMALLVPQWTERNPADMGVVLIELLAYAGDYLSYRQDAIATEAYLGTARKRVSVKRHVRLVDYPMHDGCNARTWIHLEVSAGIQNLLLTTGAGSNKTKVLTRGVGLPLVFRPDTGEFETVLQQKLRIFELMHPLVLHARHNEMQFYNWLQTDCCLPKGSTSATLAGHFPDLLTGYTLILVEIAGPVTGQPGDADPLHRHAVQLTCVELAYDPLGDPSRFPADYTPIPVTRITWHSLDALPFPICISATTHDGLVTVVSLAYGNNILADHGYSIEEKLPAVPATPTLLNGSNSQPPSADPCKKPQEISIPPRYRPSLRKGPLTQAARYDPEHPPASASLARRWSMQDPVAQISLTGDRLPGVWHPRRDLVNSKHNSEHFVVETEADGISTLRFGNDTEGQRPEPSTLFTAIYRYGNGTEGNVGAHTLGHLVSDSPSLNKDTIRALWNPLPATGGTEPESVQKARLRAPAAFRTQERAVTLADYEAVSKRCSPEIQRSTASLRWTGSWRTVFLTVDRLGGNKIDKDFEKELRGCIEKYRMAGQDLEVDGPEFVSLEIEMTVCVQPDYFRSSVKAALLELFSNRMLPNGQQGVFHPDNFTFGQPVYLSVIYAAAQQIEGVQRVTITKFQRQGTDSNKALDDGKLLLSRLEIARLDNDPNFPERGVFRLHMLGGK